MSVYQGFGFAEIFIRALVSDLADSGLTRGQRIMDIINYFHFISFHIYFHFVQVRAVAFRHLFDLKKLVEGNTCILK